MDHLDEDESLKSNMSEKEKSKLDQWREKMKFTKKAISSQRLGIMGNVSILPNLAQNGPIFVHFSTFSPYGTLYRS